MILHSKSLRPNNRGITLAELLVASVMIGIVMVGVAAFSLAIRNLHRSTDKTVIIALRTKSAIARITQDAMLATGDEQDRGIFVFSGADFNSICFRQNLVNEPDDYTNHTWVCYNHGATFVIFRSFDPAFTPPCTTNIECQGGANPVEQVLKIMDTGTDFAAIITNDAGNIKYIEIILTTRYDNLLPEEHPIDNPEYTLTTLISPQGHSR